MKVWLTGMAGAGCAKNLEELLGPIHKYFDGLVWAFHRPVDEGYDVLERYKGDGEILTIDWTKRHDFSRNHYLFSDAISYGDWCLNIDDSERLTEEFVRDGLPRLITILENNAIEAGFLSNKHFLFKKSEALHFSGNPHEGLNGFVRGVEVTQIKGFEDKDSYHKNVRGEIRDKFHFVKAYLKYYLYPNTNHLLLHFENNQEFVRTRYIWRNEFLQGLESMGVERTPEAVIEWMKKGIPPSMWDIVAKEKILNDVYRYFVLGREDFEDNHDWDDMVGE